MTNFTDWIRSELNRREWSQAELADRAGLSLSCISKMLTRGSRTPSMQFFFGIATAFEMPIADVILISKQTKQHESQGTEDQAEPG